MSVSIDSPFVSVVRAYLRDDKHPLFIKNPACIAESFGVEDPLDRTALSRAYLRVINAALQVLVAAGEVRRYGRCRSGVDPGCCYELVDEEVDRRGSK